jgi:anti-sigma factor RsiW
MTMSCTAFQDEISAYIDGELDEGIKTEVGNHLVECPPCREIKDNVKRLSSLVIESTEKCQIPDIWSALSDKLPTVCELVEEDFSAYLDGELIASAKDGVSEHLLACPPCHDKFQALSKVNGLISRSMELPAGLELDIWAGIQNRLEEDCVLIKEELSSFFDREVTPPRHRAITSHLLDCTDCRAQLASVTQTGEMLRTHYQPTLPEDFDLWPQIKAKMQVVPFAPKEKRKRAFATRRIYAVAAVVVGGVLAAIGFFVNVHSASTVQPVTAEAYLIDSALGEPAEGPESLVYENH